MNLDEELLKMWWRAGLKVHFGVEEIEIKKPDGGQE